MGFHGLVCLHDKTLWLFSATLSDFYKDAFLTAFAVGEEVIHRFETPQKLVNNVEVTQRIEMQLRLSEQDAKNAFYETVIQKANQGPVIVFVAEDDLTVF